MCDKCEELDKKIEHYRKMILAVSDQLSNELRRSLKIYTRKNWPFIRSKSSKAASVGGLFQFTGLSHGGDPPTA